MTSFRARLLAALLISSVLFASGQDAPQGTSAASASSTTPQATLAKPDTVPAMDPVELADYVKKQFGSAFKLAPVTPRGAGGQLVKGAKPVLLLTGDLDGDGMEDAVIVVQSKNPLLDQRDFNYKVIDPYDGYFGFGDARITHQFATQDPERERILLVIHSWRTTAPKAKFAIINLPFENLSIERVMAKKKTLMAIKAVEGGILTSSVYWDGKRYRYEPGTGDLE